jgi:hypothetical protein
MIIIEIQPRPRFYMVLTYANACRTFKTTTESIDKRIDDYAKRNEISKTIAFDEFIEIAADLEASRELKNDYNFDTNWSDFK